MLRISSQRFAQFATGRIRRDEHDSLVESKQRGPAGFPAGPFVKMPELSGHCHAASAGAAGAATAAACVTGRDRRRAHERHNCRNQKQIFHNSFLLRFRESSAARTRMQRARVLRRAER